MYLQMYVPKLIQDLELSAGDLSSGIPGVYTLPLEEGLSVTMTDTPSGYILKSSLGTYPTAKEDLFLTQAMMGNLFGQGTKGAILGINPEGTSLTLTSVVDYPLEYKEFKEGLEDFINMIDFWREEAANPTPLK